MQMSSEYYTGQVKISKGYFRGGGVVMWKVSNTKAWRVELHFKGFWTDIAFNCFSSCCARAGCK